MTALYQIVTEHLGLIVILDNAAGVISGNDRRGQKNAQAHDLVKSSIFKAILNSNPWNTIENPTLPDQPTRLLCTRFGDTDMTVAISLSMT
jgi:hypothetical protein